MVYQKMVLTYAYIYFTLPAGSEVQICVDVAKALGESGTRARVVSMPCWELFEEQDQAYQLSGALPPPAASLRTRRGNILCGVLAQHNPVRSLCRWSLRHKVALVLVNHPRGDLTHNRALYFRKSCNPNYCLQLSWLWLCLMPSNVIVTQPCKLLP